jgi:uncharacterized protein
MPGIAMPQLLKILRIALAVFIIVLGIAGLFLPILQGVLLLLIGFFLLSREIPWVHRQWLRLRKKYPTLFSRLDHWKQKHKKLPLL